MFTTFPKRSALGFKYHFEASFQQVLLGEETVVHLFSTSSFVQPRENSRVKLISNSSRGVCRRLEVVPIKQELTSLSGRRSERSPVCSPGNSFCANGRENVHALIISSREEGRCPYPSALDPTSRWIPGWTEVVSQDPNGPCANSRNGLQEQHHSWEPVTALALQVHKLVLF